MRSERRTLTCSACPARITLEVSAQQWAEDMARGIAGVARFLKWEVETDVRCPLHKETKNG